VQTSHCNFLRGIRRRRRRWANPLAGRSKQLVTVYQLPITAPNTAHGALHAARFLLYTGRRYAPSEFLPRLLRPRRRNRHRAPMEHPANRSLEAGLGGLPGLKSETWGTQHMTIECPGCANGACNQAEENCNWYPLHSFPVPSRASLRSGE
jgi:hypothetical protein